MTSWVIVSIFMLIIGMLLREVGALLTLLLPTTKGHARCTSPVDPDDYLPTKEELDKAILTARQNRQKAYEKELDRLRKDLSAKLKKGEICVRLRSSYDVFDRDKMAATLKQECDQRGLKMVRVHVNNNFPYPGGCDA